MHSFVYYLVKKTYNRFVVGFILILDPKKIGLYNFKNNYLNPFVTSPGDLRDLGRLFRYEARRSPGLIA